MEDLLYEKLDQYYDKFGDIFPRMEYSSLTNEEVINKINQCLKEDKPIQELMPLKAPEDAIY